MVTLGRLDLTPLHDSFRRAWQGLMRRWVAALPSPSPAPRRRFAPLQRLEDRNLLSATALGAPFRVNTYTPGPQQTFSAGPPSPTTAQRAVAMNPTTGDFVVTWASQNQDGSGWGVYAQRYNVAGTPQGGEFQVNTTTTHDQMAPSAAVNAQGNFIITWQSNAGSTGWDVFAQRYNAAGVAQGGEFQVNTTTTKDQTGPSVAIDAAGDFVVAWNSNAGAGTGWDVYAQRYNAAGAAQGGEFLVNTTTANDQQNPSVAMDPAGDFVIAWAGHQSGHWGIYAQQYNAAGTAQGGEFEVSTVTTSDQQNPSAAMDASGNFVVAWQSNDPGTGWDIYARRYSAAGAAQGSPFEVNATTAGDREFPGAVMTPGGAFGVTWSSQGQDNGGSWGIYARGYDASGSPEGGEFLVNTYTVGDQEYSSAATDGRHAVIVWSSNNQAGPGSSWDVYGQEYTIPGITVTQPSTLVTTESGGTARFTVALTSQPTGDVTVPVSSSDTTAGTVSTPQLVFTPADWNQPRTVTVTGQDDHVITPDRPYQVLLGPAQSSDTAYNGNFATSVSLTDRDNAGGIHVTGDSFLVFQDNSVVRVNALNGTVTATYPTGLANDGLAVGPDGSMYVLDYYNNQVDRYDATGAYLRSFGTGQLNSPQGAAFGPDGNLYVTNVNSTVQEFSPDGAFLRTFISAGSGGLWNAKGITWGPDGNVYVSSYFNSEVLRYNATTGAFMNVFATGTGGFEDLTFGPDGNLYVASYGDNAVYRFRGNSGQPLGAFVSGGNLSTPFGLRFDPAGNLDVSCRSLGDIETYSGSTGAFLGNLVTGLTNPSMFTAPASLVTSEAGTTADFSLVLNTQPASDVTITLTSTAPGQGALSSSSLTFTPAKWNVAQTVTVTGLDDGVVNGDQIYQINGTATSADPAYSGAEISPVVVVNKEADGTTTTTVASSASAPVYGQAVTFTAKVSESGSGTPTGTVTFFDGTTSLGSASVSGGIAVFTTSTLAAGSHPITAEYGGAPLLAPSTSAALTQSVTPAVLTVTADDASTVYGQPNPAFSADFSGFANGDTTAALGGAPVLGTTASAGSHAGIYAITAGPGTLSDPNYTFTFVSGTLTVTPAPLTVTANATRAYGQPNPPFTPSYTGLVNGDTPASLGGTPALQAGARVGSPPGTYPIAVGPGTLNDPDYAFTFVNGTLTIVPAVLTVTANDAGKVYGQPNPAFTASYLGFANGDTSAALGGALTFATTATAASGVGSYGVTPGGLASAKYAITFAPGTLTVTPAPLTVTADDATRAYGQTNPAFTASYSGFVNGDTPAKLGGTPSLNASATAGSAVGAYTITAGRGTLNDPNYALGFVNGSLKVTPAALTVTANNASKVYGQANPAFSASYSGFVNGDGPDTLGGGLVFATPAATGSPAGTYPITPGGLAAGDYVVSFVRGSLVITPAGAGSPGPAIPPIVGPVVLAVPTPGRGNPAPPAPVPSSVPAPAPSLAPDGAAAADDKTRPGPTAGAGATAAAGPTGRQPGASVTWAVGQPVPPIAPGAEAVRASGGGGGVVPAGPPATTPLFTPLIQPVLLFVSPRGAGGAAGDVAGGAETVADQSPMPGAAPPETATPPPADARLELLPRLSWPDPAQMAHGVELLGLPPQTAALVGTGILASTGYLLLNTRTGVWLLSLLAAQPLWKELDPLEVLYAWERERESDEEEGETLLSLVQ